MCPLPLSVHSGPRLWLCQQSWPCPAAPLGAASRTLATAMGCPAASTVQDHAVLLSFAPAEWHWLTKQR